MRGEVPNSPRLILHMLGQLPEGSRYELKRQGNQRDTGDQPELLPEDVELDLDRRYWNGDRMLMAKMINAINENSRIALNLPKGRESPYPVEGPIAWHPPSQREKTRKSRTPATVVNVLKAFGWSG